MPSVSASLEFLNEPLNWLLIFLAGVLCIITYIFLTYDKTTISPARQAFLYQTSPTVLSVSLSPDHVFTKTPQASITLVPGLGVEGDCHLGETVQHRSRMHIQPPPANLRQVHLLQHEILQEYGLQPAAIGENVTTSGIDLLSLGKGTKLRFVPLDPAIAINPSTEPGIQSVLKAPCVTVTGLRNPCPQIEKFQSGLQEKFIRRDAQLRIIERKAGVMGTVEVGGEVRPGMRILVQKPQKHIPLECV